MPFEKIDGTRSVRDGIQIVDKSNTAQIGGHGVQTAPNPPSAAPSPGSSGVTANTPIQKRTVQQPQGQQPTQGALESLGNNQTGSLPKLKDPTSKDDRNNNTGLNRSDATARKRSGAFNINPKNAEPRDIPEKALGPEEWRNLLIPQHAVGPEEWQNLKQVAKRSDDAKLLMSLDKALAQKDGGATGNNHPTAPESPMLTLEALDAAILGTVRRETNDVNNNNNNQSPSGPSAEKKDDQTAKQ